MKMRVLIVSILLVVLILISSCTITPTFIKGENYIIEGEYTSFHTINGSLIYVVGGNTIILGNKQPQPNLTIGHIYRITWVQLTNDPNIIEIVSVEDKGN